MVSRPVAVIGAGPAGLSAVQQLGLYRIPAVVFEKNVPGGLLRNAGSVRNYPGVPPGISGPDLVSLFELPENLVTCEITGVMRRSDGIYQVSWKEGTACFTVVITASGTCPVRIEIPDFPQERVFYHVTDVRKDLFSSAAVLGGGDAALDYALTLCRFMDVTVYARSGFKGASRHLHEQALATPELTLVPEAPFPFTPDEDIAVVACGRKPNVAFVSEELLCSPPEDGSFHLAGDCRGGRYRQTAIAVGNGVMAAMKTAEFLS